MRGAWYEKGSGTGKKDEGGAEPEQVDENVSIVEVIVAKNRNGQVGTVELVFTKNIGRFDDQAYDHEEDDE